MFGWWSNLGLKGKLYFWGFFGIAVNAGVYFIGFWYPVALFVSIGLIVIGFILPADT